MNQVALSVHRGDSACLQLPVPQIHWLIQGPHWGPAQSLHNISTFTRCLQCSLPFPSKKKKKKIVITEKTQIKEAFVTWAFDGTQEIYRKDGGSDTHRCRLMGDRTVYSSVPETMGFVASEAPPLHNKIYLLSVSNCQAKCFSIKCR